MRWTFPLCLGLGLGMLPALAQSPPADTFALVGVRVEVGDGRVLDKATILLRHGLIVAIGPNVSVPADAEVIKGDGLTVYPGFIDGQMLSGFTFPAAQADQDRPPDTGAEAPASMRLANRKGIRPEMRAADYLTLSDAALGPIRQAGFTTALVAPSGGSIGGVSALVNLSGAPKRDAVVRSAVTMGFGFGGGGGRGFNADPSAPRPSGTGYPGSLLGYIALLRQTLLDAQYYRTVDTAFAKGAGQRPPADDSLVALQNVLSGAMPVVFDADSDNQIVRAMNIADEFGLKLIVGGGGDAWKLAPTLAKKQIPVLVSLNFGDEPGVLKSPAGAPGLPGTPGVGRPGGGGRRGQGAPAAPPAGAVIAPPAAPGGSPPVPPVVAGGSPAVPPVVPGANPAVPPAIPGAPPADAPVLPSSIVTVSPDDEDDTPKAVVAEQHRKWEEKVANAARLQSAGVPFVFTTRGVHTPMEFMDNLRKAIKAGLSRTDALKALTMNAARLYSVDRQMGTVEAGKIADLVVMSGDFADPKTKVRYVFIDKSKFDLENDRPAARPVSPFFGPGEDDDR